MERISTSLQIELKLTLCIFKENCALTEENLMEFLGILEKKGLDIITEYARLLAEVTDFMKSIPQLI